MDQQHEDNTEPEGRSVVNEALVTGAMRLLAIARAVLEHRTPPETIETAVGDDPNVDVAFDLLCADGGPLAGEEEGAPFPPMGQALLRAESLGDRETVRRILNERAAQAIPSPLVKATAMEPRARTGGLGNGETRQWWLSCVDADTPKADKFLGVVIVAADSFLDAVRSAQARGVLPDGPLDAHHRDEEHDDPDEPTTYICRKGGHIHIKGGLMRPSDHVGSELQNRLLTKEELTALQRLWRNRPKTPATFHDLDEMARGGCVQPDCREHHQHTPLETVFLHSKCHPNVGLWARYSTLRRTVLLLSKKCRKPLVELAIGDRWHGDILPSVRSDPTGPDVGSDLE
jgi:hypothetical protein